MKTSTIYIRALREITECKDIHIEVSPRDVMKYLKKKVSVFGSRAKWDDHHVLYSYVEDMVDLSRAKGDYDTLDSDEPWEVNEVSQID